MAEQLELDEIRAHALNNIGNARVTLGDAGGVADLERSVEISAAVGSVESVRGYLNLGTTLDHLGHLERAFAVHAEGRRLAERLGDATGIRWFAVERLFECYWTGWWDEAAADVEALLAAVEVPGRLLHRARSPAGPRLDPPGAWRSRRRPRRCRALRRARPGGPLPAGALPGARARGTDERGRRRRGPQPRSWPASCSSPGAGAPSRPAGFWTADLTFALAAPRPW